MGKRVEISYSLYGSKLEPSEVSRALARAHGVAWKAGDPPIRIERAAGQKVLSVHAVAEPHPGCGVKPDVRERTVIVVSERIAEQ